MLLRKGQQQSVQVSSDHVSIFLVANPHIFPMVTF